MTCETMSKPIFTPDLGIIAPKTLAPAGGKIGVDPSFTADAFEGALSSAVARQRDEDVKTQQAQRAKALQDSQKHRDRAAADQPGAAWMESADASTAPAKDEAKSSPPRNAKSAASKRDEVDAATRDAKAAAKSAASTDDAGVVVDVASDAGQTTVADGSTAGSNSDAGGDQTAADRLSDATTSADAAQIVVAVVVAPTIIADAAPSVEAAAAPPEGGTVLSPAPAPAGSDPLSANSDPAQSGAAQPGASVAPRVDSGQTVAASPGADARAATSGSLPTADAASNDVQAQTAATQSVAAGTAPSTPENAAPEAPTPQAAPAQATPAQAAQAQSASASPGAGQTAAAQTAAAQTAAAQDVAPQSIAAQSIATQAAAVQAAAQAAGQAAAAGTPAQPASAPAAAKPFIPAESSSIASLKDAIDIPTTVTYTARAPAASQNGSAAGFGSSNGGGAGLGGNASNQTAVPVRAAGAAAIVAQDVGQTGLTAFEEVLATTAPEALAADPASADDLPLVDTKSSSAQPMTNAQSLANRASFDAPGAQQGAPAARSHHVLLPLANQVTAGLAKLAQSGGGEINIHLQPANLGRVDVSMKIAEDGRMTATITADRQDTLDLLRRDSYALERSLAEAGLKADDGGLQFSLRGEGGQRDRDSADSRGGRPLAPIADPEPIQASPTRRASSLSRLDMRI